MAPADYPAEIWAAPDAFGRARAVDAFLHDVAQTQRSATDADVVDAAWSVLEALHIAGAGREIGRHFWAHQPQVELKALRARCLRFHHYGSSRFAHTDAVHLLRLRQRALALVQAEGGTPLTCYSLHLGCQALRGDGVMVDPASKEVVYYQGSQTVRFILRHMGSGAVDVIAAYPVRQKARFGELNEKLVPM